MILLYKVITWPIMLKTHLSCSLKIKKIPLACESTAPVMKQKNNRKSRGIPQDHSDSLQLIGDSEQKTFLDTAPCGQNVVELIHCNGQKTKVETKVNQIQPSEKRQICRELIINIEFTERQVNPIIYTYAIACPSEVDVPRPSSSNATNELRVAEDCINHQKYVNGMKIIQSYSS